MWLASTSAGSVGRIDGEAVVLGRDLDLAGRLVAHRVIGAPMAEFELECLGTERLAEELMAQADSEDRDSPTVGRGSGSGSAAWPSPRPEGGDHRGRSR